MTTYEEPHLGWHTVTWGSLRRWWVHRKEHKSGDLNAGHQWCHRTDEDDDAEAEVETPETDPEELEAPPPRWRGWAQAAQTVGLWCVGALVAVIAIDPPSWLLALAIGCVGAGLVIQRTAHRRTVEQLAHQIARERADLASAAQRKQRRAVNQAAHAAERAAQHEEARAAREAKRTANREQYRGSEEP